MRVEQKTFNIALNWQLRSVESIEPALLSVLMSVRLFVCMNIKISVIIIGGKSKFLIQDFYILLCFKACLSIQPRLVLLP